MDLKSGYPWWAVRNGRPCQFPRLQADLRCDVAIVGGGISAALVADALVAGGHDVALFERRDIGWGSTAASTALLQYELDTPMTELARWYGEADAVLAYRSCVEAIQQIAARAGSLRDVGLARAASVQYASRPAHAAALRAECELRARHGFAVRWLDPAQVRAAYGFDAPGALRSRVAARVDPYRLTYRLLAALQRRGTGVFDRTEVAALQPHGRGVTLRTGDGHRIEARHVVMAAGYESQAWLRQRMARNRSSYAFVSDPLARDALGPLASTLFWETAHPYLYLRGSDDGRVLVGGADDAVDIPARRDRRVATKTRKLLAQAQALFPGLELRPAFAWAGTFAETADGLPFFGAHRQYGPRVLFAMAYGGNGIAYSMAGAGLLRALVERRPHPLAALFGFARLERRGRHC